MALLIDRLRADKRWRKLSEATEDERVVKKWLVDESVPVYDITNVARYLATTGAKFAKTDWEAAVNFQSFPNVAPPHRLYWMEMARPATVFHLRERSYYPDRLGLAVWESQPHDEERWYVHCTCFGEWRNRVHPLVTWNVEFVRDGYPELIDTHIYKRIHELFGDRPHPTPQEPPNMDDYKNLSREELDLMLEEARGRLAEADRELDVLNLKLDAVYARWIGITMLYSALMAHSLLACKNVEQDTHRPDAGLAKAWERRHGEALMRFTTLRVKPMGRGGESVGDGNGIDQALHIVRGHFKTYTPERPLLGRFAGTYWWESQVRGDAKNGVIVKDYEVVA